MGYNVTQNGPGPGTPDAFYALAGCAAPTETWEEVREADRFRFNQKHQ